MSEQDAARWKKKFLDLADESERQEKLLLDFENLLKSALVRMSLAAEGQDSKLDQSMQALRRDLRDHKVDRGAIARQLAQIDARLLELENGPASEPSSPGKAGATSPLDQAASMVTDLNATLAAAAESQGQTLSAQQEEELASVFRQILQSLPEDELTRPLLDDLRQQVSCELDWNGWLGLLQKLAELIQMMLGSSQESFGDFLISVEEKLNSLQEVFSGSELASMLDALNAGGSHHELDASVAELRANISHDHPDMGSLRESVTRSLDAVTVSVDQFIQRELDKQQGMREQLVALQGQLEELQESAQQARAQLEREQKLARTDTLTGLPNRLAWRARLAEENERFQRYGRPLSMAIIDIDRFKAVNDDFGHPAGDRVLQLIAQELMARTRKTDFLARLGGEEFAVLMAETSGESAHTVINKMRSRVSRMPFNFRGRELTITVSAGVAQFRQETQPEEVFERADAALYEAKKGGRNQVRLARSET